MSAQSSERAERLETDKTRVTCNGGGGALGHPKVFLEIPTNGDVMCPYCSKHFILSGDAANTPQAH